jgi:hypothetical protein
MDDQEDQTGNRQHCHGRTPHCLAASIIHFAHKKSGANIDAQGNAAI